MHKKYSCLLSLIHHMRRYPRSYIEIMIATLFIILLIMQLLRSVADSVVDHTTTLKPVHTLAANGEAMLVLRFPDHSSQLQEEIIVYNRSREMLTMRRIADLAERGPHPSNVVLHLNIEQWQPIDILRQDWCQATPQFQNAPDEVFYDIGLYCSRHGHPIGDTRRVQVPVGNLPPELAKLIETVPSPTCDDPFCGWQE